MSVNKWKIGKMISVQNPGKDGVCSRGRPGRV